jgi:glycosyltransferase involved in cell wall biosynthesis
MSETASLPSVSVVVPLYNHEAYLACALDSILCQTLPDAEVLVLDDGSTDGSAAIARRYAGRHPQIRFSSHANRGAHHTINAGIEAARADYVAILNSDDAYAPERLRECIGALARRPDAAAVATGIEFMDEAGRPTHNAWYEQACAFYAEAGDLALALANGNFIMTTSNLVVRRSVFAELGGFHGLRYAHDLDFLLRLLAAGRKIHLIDRALLRYRMHDANTIREDHRKVRAEWASVVSCFAHQVFAHRPPAPETWDYCRRLLAIAERHQLTRMMFMFLAFFRSLPPGAATSDAFLHHPEFQRHIMELA